MNEPMPPEPTPAAPPPAPPGDATPRRPPEPAWIEAEAALLAEGDALVDAFRESFAAWYAAAEAGVLGPLRAQVQRAAQSHERLRRSTLGTLPDFSPPAAKPAPAPEPASKPEPEAEPALAYPPDPGTLALDEEALEAAEAERKKAETAEREAADAEAESERQAEAARLASAEAELLRALWEQARAYRRGVQKRVIAPLRKHLAGDVLPESLADPLEEALAALGERAGAAEAHVTLPLSADLFAPTAKDTPARALHKRLRRTHILGQQASRSALNAVRGVFNKPAVVLPALSRQVPARELLQHHVRERLYRLAVAPHAEAQQHLADAVGALEIALAAWTKDALQAEEALDRPGLHRPDVLAKDDLMPPETARSKADAAGAAVAEAAKDGRDGKGDTSARALHAQFEHIAQAFQDALAAIRLTPLGEAPDTPAPTAPELGAPGAEPGEATEPSETEPPRRIAALGTEGLEAARAAWRADVARGGTFLLKKLGTARKRGEAGYAEAVAREAEAWVPWHAEALERVHLYHHLTRLRYELLRVEDGLLGELAGAVIAPIHEAFRPMMAELAVLQREAAEACDQAQASAGGAAESDPGVAQREAAALAERLSSLQARGLAFLNQALRDLPGLVTATQALTDPGRTAFAEARALLPGIPESLALHTLPDASAAHAADRHARRFAVRLRDQADRAINPPYPERLRSTADALRQRVSHVWGETEQVRHIVQYNLGAAIDELREPGEPDAPATPKDAFAPRSDAHAATPHEPAGEGHAEDDATPPSDPHQRALDAARELAADGLRRASETLPELAQSLGGPWTELRRALFRAAEEDWVALHRAARSDAFIEGQWVNLRTKLSRDFKQYQREAGRAWERLRERGAKLLRIGQRRAKQLIKKGQSAVGVLEASEEERLVTLDAITSVPTLLEALPLVYRRLFAFEPLSEPALLEGRSRDLARLRLHLKRWKEGQEAGALLVAMPLGSGRTSLLNVAETRLAEDQDARVVRVAFAHRVRSEHDLVVALAEALGLADIVAEEQGEGSDEALAFDDLERALEGRPREKTHRVVLVDDLEHLVLRARGGSRLVERFLVFLSRTDNLVFWALAVSDSAWGFLERTSRAAAGLVTVHRPEPVDRATLEEIVVGRHRRSGLPLAFDAPPDLPPLTKQRLRRAGTPEETQAVLREDYFDRLHRAAGQNIMLALLQWLRSADFQSEAGILHVRPLDPLSFRFLSTFDRDRAFTLKAFLDHKTLTLEDHDRIFRMSSAQSTFLLEALLNQRLIVPHGAPRGTPATGRIDPDIAYRIRPLILNPLTQYLRGQHIVY